MMRRLLATLGVTCLAFTLVLRAADPVPMGPTKSAGDLSPEQIEALQKETAFKQAQMKREFEEFRTAILTLAQRLEASPRQEDKDKARLLREAIELANQQGVETKFQGMMALLKKEKALGSLDTLENLFKSNESLRADLLALIKLLQSDDPDARLREERMRLERMLERLKEVIAKQERVRAQTEIGRKDPTELKREQDRVTQETKGVISGKEAGKEEKGATKAEGKPGESKTSGVAEGKEDARDLKGEKKPEAGTPGQGQGTPSENKNPADAGAKEGNKEGAAEGKQGQQSGMQQGEQPGSGKQGEQGGMQGGQQGQQSQGKEGGQQGQQGQQGEGKEGGQGGMQGGQGQQGENKQGGQQGQQGGQQSEGKQGGQGGQQGQQGEGKQGAGQGENKQGGQSGMGQQSQGKEGGQQGGQGQGKEGGGQQGENKQGGGQQGEGKQGGQQGQPSGQQAGQPKPGQPGGQGEGKPGSQAGQPSGQQGQQGGQGKEGGQQGGQGEGKPGGQGGMSGQQGGQGKEGGQQGQQGQQGGQKGKEDGKGENKPGQQGGMGGQGGQGGEGKPGQQGQGGQGGQSQGKGQGGEGGQGGQGGKQGQQPQPQSPEEQEARKRIEESNKYQESAGKKIEGKDNPGAGNDQDEAIKELERARKELEKLLKQKRQEEIERLLAKLQGRCEFMLALQRRVRDETVKVNDETKDQKLTEAQQRDKETKSNDLMIKEEEIVKEANLAIRLIEAEGSAIAFAEVFKQVRGDMINVTQRFRRTDVGDVTIAIENDIIATLEEMIEALKKARQENQSPPQPPKPGEPQKPGPQNLLDQIAELKLIRSMQKRVNDRTELYAKKYSGEQAPVPAEAPDAKSREDAEAILKEMRDLSGSQEKIGKITRDIALGRNKDLEQPKR